MISFDMDQTNQDCPGADTDAALSSLAGLARLSRLTLLYHGPAADGAREQAAALAAAADGGDVAVLFDAGSEMRLADLFSAIEEAVLEARPQAPLAPPMAGPVEALLAWQQALGLRFMLIFYRFDAALDHPDPEFDRVLLRLVRDPALELSLLLMMDETAAPRLDRLRADIPELGEDYLRMPEPVAPAAPIPRPEPTPEPSLPPRPDARQRTGEAAAAPAETPPQTQPPAAPPALFWPDPEFAGEDDITRPNPAFGGNDDLARAPQQEPADAQALQRRRRPFPSLLEQAAPALAIDSADAAQTAAPLARAPQPGQGAAHAYRERRPLPVSEWMQKRQGRRRRATLAIAASTGMTSTVLLFLMLALALLCWELPLLS